MGGIAAGIFGQTQFGGLGGVSLTAQLIGTITGILIALISGFVIYGVLKKAVGLRLDPEEEYEGADLSIHRITSTPDRESTW